MGGWRKLRRSFGTNERSRFSGLHKSKYLGFKVKIGFWRKFRSVKMGDSVKLFLHSNGQSGGLDSAYRRALTSAEELLIVSAYLMHWDANIALNPNCKRFMMIVGKDFGLTRKLACEAVLKWLPGNQKVHFRVADQINGFHPKAVFWREAGGQAYAIIGSSNLSLAAFKSNYEANIVLPICSADYDAARHWVDEIAAQSVPISTDWLEKYQESSPRRGKKKPSAEFLPIPLPDPKGATAAVRLRRKTLEKYLRNRNGLIELFRECAAGNISSTTFYSNLPNHWGGEAGGRLQGNGWERLGKKANFRELAQSYIKIIEAPSAERDDVVVDQLDHLATNKNPARKAFLSEMLCLEFPNHYPVLNRPVQDYLTEINFKGASGMSEGARYLDLAIKLRLSLDQNPKHPARNIAELDTVFWLASRKPDLA